MHHITPNEMFCIYIDMKIFQETGPQILGKPIL